MLISKFAFLLLRCAMFFDMKSCPLSRERQPSSSTKCGLQNQGFRPIKTVVSVLEEALVTSRLSQNPHVVTSSRTDKGVHATCSTIHTDLPTRKNGEPYDPTYITATLNRAFLDLREDVRVLKTLRVADNFHCRFQAVNRTYVYRICVAKDPNLCWAMPYPPFEFQRSCLIRSPLNMDAVQGAAKILNGVHDFRAFTNPSSLNKQTWINPVKAVTVSVEPGDGFLIKYTKNDDFDYWNFVFNSHSFLYKQVRNMSAILIAAGQGHLSLEKVRDLVDNPTEVGAVNKTSIYNVPAHALYLTNVEYQDKDLVFDQLETTTAKSINESGSLQT